MATYGSLLRANARDSLPESFYIMSAEVLSLCKKQARMCGQDCTASGWMPVEAALNQ